MRILMLGWEYPPKISGGLGIASQGLATAMAQLGHQVTFLLPKIPPQTNSNSVTMMEANSIIHTTEINKSRNEFYEHVKYLEVGAALLPYLDKDVFEKKRITESRSKKISWKESLETLEKIQLNGGYGPNLMQEIAKYSFMALQLAEKEQFDVIHCHDWMTFKAGLAIQKLNKSKVIYHFHSTETQRNGIHASAAIQKIEETACQEGHSVITVSQLTKDSLINDYQAISKKVKVVANGYSKVLKQHQSKDKQVPLIGFAGRFTDQKNPFKFISIARQLISAGLNAKFIMIGDGHLMEGVRNMITSLNLESHIELTGFLTHEKAVREISDMDMLLVTSYDEPFGLVPLEGISQKTAVIVSDKCGIAEFVPGLIQIPSWDEFQWVNTIKTLLNNPDELAKYIEAISKGSEGLTWEQSAKETIKIYNKSK